MEIKFTDGTELTLPSNKKHAARYMADMIRNRGELPDSEIVVPWENIANILSPKHRDAISSSEITPLLQQSMEILIREPVEPRMVITPLFTRVQARGLNTQILAGAMGAVYAGDVQESGTYPEVNFQMGGAVSTAFIGKSGIAASFTDEALRYSTFDIMAKNLELMGNALVRHKEQKAVAFLKQLGTALFDNLNPAQSIYGVTTGRGLDTNNNLIGNGSLNMDNLMRAMAHMSEEGFTPDTLLMHPLFYYTFIQDPVLRTMMLAHGGGSIFNPYSGDPGPRDPFSNGAIGARGPSRGTSIVNPRGTGTSGIGSSGTATSLAERSQLATSAPRLPSYFPFGFQIIVSPLCPYDPETETGDIFLLSSGNVGFHLVDEDATTVEWRDETTETVKIKIRERYGFAVAHEGQGVGVFKNIKCSANEWDGSVDATATLKAVLETDVKASL
jgi:hypothetical protein